MPLYIADYLADTAHLGALKSGGYLHLIMHYWRVGKLPKDDASLARIAKMTDREWAQSKDTLLDFFDADMRHKRIDSELEKATVKSEARASCGARGGKAKALKLKGTSLAKATILPEQNAKQKDDFALASSSQSQSERKKEDLGTSPKSLPASAPSAFAKKFYDAYPRHVDPRAAEKAFAQAVNRGVPPERIIAAAERFAEATRRAGTEKQFIPHPATWLNRGSYDSEDLPAAPTPQARAGPAKPYQPLTNPAAKIMRELAEKSDARQQFSDNPGGAAASPGVPRTVGLEDLFRGEVGAGSTRRVLDLVAEPSDAGTSYRFGRAAE
jgi:uncharacterized protein YdaU (DUF1376 family)